MWAEEVVQGHYALHAPGTLVVDEREGDDERKADGRAAFRFLEKDGELVAQRCVAGFEDTEDGGESAAVGNAGLLGNFLTRVAYALFATG